MAMMMSYVFSSHNASVHNDDDLEEALRISQQAYDDAQNGRTSSTVDTEGIEAVLVLYNVDLDCSYCSEEIVVTTTSFSLRA